MVFEAQLGAGSDCHSTRLHNFIEEVQHSSGFAASEFPDLAEPGD
jgi:hypothetical protein